MVCSLHQGSLDIVQSMNLYKSIMMCIHHYGITENSFITLNFFVLYLLILCPNPWQPLIFPFFFFYCLHSFNFSRISHTSNHSVCNLGKLSFFTWNNFLGSHPGCCVYQQVCFFSLLSNIPWYGYTIVCLNIYLLKDIWCISSYGTLPKMVLGMNRVACPPKSYVVLTCSTSEYNFF